MGLKLQSNRIITGPLKENTIRTRNTITNLRIFRHLNENIQVHLHKAVVTPPGVPTRPPHTLSCSKKRKFQTIQNKAIREATKLQPPHNSTVEQPQNQYDIEPLNIRIHRRVKNVWEKIQNVKDPVLNITMEEKIKVTHRRWPKSLSQE